MAQRNRREIKRPSRFQQDESDDEGHASSANTSVKRRQTDSNLQLMASTLIDNEPNERTTSQAQASTVTRHASSANTSEKRRRQSGSNLQLVGCTVLFTPEKESFCQVNGRVKSMYVEKRLAQTELEAVVRKNVGRHQYELVWKNSAIQNHRPIVNEVDVTRGVFQFQQRESEHVSDRRYQRRISGSGVPELTDTFVDESDMEDDAVAIDDYDRLENGQTEPLTLDNIEMYDSMDFVENAYMDRPNNLWRHEGRNLDPNESYVRDEYIHVFQHSAVASFLAFLPLQFWRIVLKESNRYASMHKIRGAEITLDELMIFLGLTFHMTLIDRGEYSNYWGPWSETEPITGAPTLGYDHIMSLNRFKFIRRCLTVQIPGSEVSDPLFRIRPMINALRERAKEILVLGRNVSVDESSIACRSKFARHLIVFNPTKPGGKYHFRMYVLTCAKNWFLFNVRVHARDELEHRMTVRAS